MALQEVSPLTGIIAEEDVVLDFGEHEGKSVLEVQDTLPEYYEFLLTKKSDGQCTIRRTRDKMFKLYVSRTLN